MGVDNYPDLTKRLAEAESDSARLKILRDEITRNELAISAERAKQRQHPSEHLAEAIRLQQQDLQELHRRIKTLLTRS